MKAHGFTDRPSKDLDFATAADRPIIEVAEGCAEAFRKAGFDVTILDGNHYRYVRLLVIDPIAERSCEFDVMREALQQRPAICGELWVVSLEDAIGLKMRALVGRSVPRDVIDIASVSHLYSFRGLESLARLHSDEFEMSELVARLEYIEFIEDDAFADYGIEEDRIKEIRRFAQAWVDDIKLRRVEDGDADYESADIPELD
ncbi:nucleotidyl transferase AbiEii/AbiGii toxin family protein [Streptosporangiaceae bacterium NEAU-GS5]|nr:nucleotidyl transferase AbiEii/AbiGii toxin family protein [Streptosporangiaceae bacterium NEAU-GS5]